MERFLLTAIALLFQKTPDGVNAYRKIQIFDDFYTSDIRLGVQKSQDVPPFRFCDFGLAAPKICPGLIASGFFSAL